MPTSINRVQLLGNLGRDAETKTFEGSDSKLVTLSIATSYRRKVGEEWQDEVEWHKVSCWNCERVAPYLKKGSKVMIEGRLRTRKWEQDGEKRSVTEVVVSGAGGIYLLGSKGGGSGSGEGPPPSAPPPAIEVAF